MTYVEIVNGSPVIHSHEIKTSGTAGTSLDKWLEQNADELKQIKRADRACDFRGTYGSVDNKMRLERDPRRERFNELLALFQSKN